MNNKFTTYLVYAIGEIILVVVGILIAVQIDDWNNKKSEQAQQIQYYKGILVDLRKDSLYFASRITSFKRSLDLYYDIYQQMEGTYTKETPPFYDRLLYNTQFFSLTQQNQRLVIDKLQNNAIREQLNSYFQRYIQVQDACNEYNATVLGLARPFFLKSDAMQLDIVFQEDKYGFLPKDPILAAEKVPLLTSSREFQEILASLRISSGYALATLGSLSQVNATLIQTLSDEIK